MDVLQRLFINNPREGGFPIDYVRAFLIWCPLETIPKSEFLPGIAHSPKSNAYNGNLTDGERVSAQDPLVIRLQRAAHIDHVVVRVAREGLPDIDDLNADDVTGSLVSFTEDGYEEIVHSGTHQTGFGESGSYLEFTMWFNALWNGNWWREPAEGIKIFPRWQADAECTVLDVDIYRRKF